MQLADKIYFGGRLALRPMTAAVADGLLVARWRNTPQARANFFSQAVVTPETHAAFIANKRPYDQVWMVEKVAEPDGVVPVGTAALYIHPADYSAETGPLLIAPEWQGQGLAKETDYLMLATAFEFFELQWLWGDAFASNAAVLSLHDKVGFKRAGIDLPGHMHPRAPIQHITYDRATWAVRRADFMAIGAQLGEWLP